MKMVKAGWMNPTLFFGLAWVSSAWSKPVQEQMDFCLISDPDALHIELIYQHGEDDHNLWQKNGSLPNCSSEPVPLKTCRVCKKNDQEVEATCRRVRSLAELHVEGNGTALQKNCSLHVITPTPAPPTQSMATPLQFDAAPPPGPGAGVIAGICVVLGVGVGVGVGVAYTKREKIRPWWSRRRTRVPTMDQEMTERAPAANGHAPPRPR